MHNRLLYDLVALLLRLGTGVVFMAHGWQKIQVGVTATANEFSALGVPAPTATAIYATFTELLGGAALVIGVVLPVAGLLLFLEMAGTFLLIHTGDGPGLVDRSRASGGRELVLVLGLVALFMAVGGAGRFTLDRRLFGRDRGDQGDTAADDDFWGDGTPIGMGVGTTKEAKGVREATASREEVSRANATGEVERAADATGRTEGRRLSSLLRRKRPGEPSLPADATTGGPSTGTPTGPATGTPTGSTRRSTKGGTKGTAPGAEKADTSVPGGKGAEGAAGTASRTPALAGRKPAAGAKSTKREAKPRLAAEIAGDSADDDPPDVLVADRKGRAVRRPPASGTGPAGTSPRKDTGTGESP